MLLIAALQYFLVAIIIEIMHKNFAYINANIIFQLISTCNNVVYLMT